MIGVGIHVVDITDRKAAELELRRHPQTGVCTRRMLFTELERALDDAARDRRAGALLLLDIDNLTATNDTNGHAAGDQLL